MPDSLIQLCPSYPKILEESSQIALNDVRNERKKTRLPDATETVTEFM